MGKQPNRRQGIAPVKLVFICLVICIIFTVNIRLFDALDLCWEILAECFEPAETGIRRSIIDKHWPKQDGEGECQSEVKSEAIQTEA